VLPSRPVISPGLVTCRLWKYLIARRKPAFLTSLAALRGATQMRLRSCFSGHHPVAGCSGKIWMSQITDCFLFNLSRAELANVLFAYPSAHAGFFVGLDRCRLLRRAVLDRPAFRHRPSALFPGGDQQDFDIVVPYAMRRGLRTA
jgi:hypothetical protein